MTIQRRAPRFPPARRELCQASDAELAEEVAVALAGASRLRGFGGALRQRYEADTRTQRITHLRRMIVLGLSFFSLYNVSGFVTLPHFCWLNVFLRVCVMTPTALGLVFVLARMSDRLREALTGGAMLGAAAIPLLLFVVSDGPLTACFMSAEILLSVVYANITLNLRFPWACMVSGAMVAGLFASLCFKPEISFGLAAVVLLNLVTGTIYSLAANFRIERESRLNYLLTLRETLRVKSLARHNDALTHLSTTDALTGLCNRRSLQERLPLLNDDLAHGLPLAVLMVDVDHFKAFNDRYGHAAGDECLRSMATVLSDACRSEGDVAIRLGGEEFLLVLPGRSSADALSEAQRLCAAVSSLGIAHVGRPDDTTKVTVSVGVSGTDLGRGRGFETLTRSADAALYAAKSSGRNRACRDVAGAPQPACAAA